MAKMTGDELQGVVARAIEDAEDFIDGDIASERALLTRYYKGEPFNGDRGIQEVDGQSKFVSRDVHDVVQMILPSVMDVFFGSERVVEYVPRLPEQLPMAQQATDYVNYLIREDNDGFNIFYAALKDALVRKAGFIKYWWDESTEVEGCDYSGVTPDDLMALASTLGPDDDVVDPEQDEETGKLSFSVIKKHKRGRLKVAAIPPEEFLINRKAATIGDADDAWHRTTKTVSELVAMGYDREEIEELSGNGDDVGNDEERVARNEDASEDDGRDDAAMRPVKYWEGYIRLDYDGDGIAELRHVCCAGEEKKVLRNSYAKRAQFIDLATDPEPHTFFGGCPGEDVADLQAVKSQVLRLANDSMVQEVHPRLFAVDGQVNMDDLLSGDIGQPVRVRAPGMVGQIPTGNSAPTALTFAQFYDEVRENRTGQSKASAGMDADALQSTTRAAVEMTRQSAQQRVKMMVRILAERGFKALFKGILELIHRHQDEQRIVMLRGQFVPIDPRQYDPNMAVSVNVGLGFGNVEQKQAYLMGTLGVQRETMQAMGPGNPLVGIDNIYNTLDDLGRLNEQTTSRYFKRPDPNWQPPKPDPQPNPIVEAEKIKATIKAQTDMAKLKADQDFQRDKLVVDAVKDAIGKGMDVTMIQQYAEAIKQVIGAPRTDMGTQMGGV
jgi:hypothetical protein